MLNLIPAPRGSVHMQEGSVKLPETVTVSLGDFAPWCLEAFAARLDGHVETVENGFITLTESGRAVAEKIYERHTVLTAFLTALGVDAETAAEDACRIEHVLSEETFDKLKQHAKAYIDAQGK